MNLRDIVKETDVDNLQVLLDTPFEFDKDDVHLVYAIGARYRGSKEGLSKYYDYSPESQVYLTFCYHKLKSIVQPHTLQLFRDAILKFDELYKQAPNQPDVINPKTGLTYSEEKGNALRELASTQDKDTVLYIVKLADCYFKYMQDSSVGEPDKNAMMYRHPLLGLIHDRFQGNYTTKEAHEVHAYKSAKHFFLWRFAEACKVSSDR